MSSAQLNERILRREAKQNEEDKNRWYERFKEERKRADKQKEQLDEIKSQLDTITETLNVISYLLLKSHILLYNLISSKKKS